MPVGCTVCKTMSVMQVKIVCSNDSMDSITLIFLKPSCKTVNTSENFLNVYCFATSQMRDEITKDNRDGYLL